MVVVASALTMTWMGPPELVLYDVPLATKLAVKSWVPTESEEEVVALQLDCPALTGDSAQVMLFELLTESANVMKPVGSPL